MLMRDRFYSFILGAAVLGLLAGLPSTLTAAEDCPRGTLDKLYCDRDGDQIADLPLDEKPPQSWWTLRGLLKQMQRHYNEHTANVMRKFELPDWPDAPAP